MQVIIIKDNVIMSKIDHNDIWLTVYTFGFHQVMFLWNKNQKAV